MNEAHVLTVETTDGWGEVHVASLLVRLEGESVFLELEKHAGGRVRANADEMRSALEPSA